MCSAPLRGSVLVFAFLCGWSGARAQLPAPPVPAENPITPDRAVLGKILFWDEQLSSDNTMACGTCHITGAAGTDPILAPHPGPDGMAGTPDDMRTSFGVIRADASDDYLPDGVFGLTRQMTGRSAPPAILAMYAPETFWDGRAGGEFFESLWPAVAAYAGAGKVYRDTHRRIAREFVKGEPHRSDVRFLGHAQPIERGHKAASGKFDAIR